MTFGGFLPKQSSFGEQFGSGLGQGLAGSLSQFFQEKQQLSKNRKSASALAKKLGLDEKEQSTFIDMMQGLDPKDQINALSKLEEAKAFERYSNNESKEPESNYGPQEGGIPTGKIKLGDIEWDRSELPKKKNRIPPYGILKDASNQEAAELKEDRKEIREFSKAYEDIPKLEEQVRDMERLQEIIERGDLDASEWKKILLAVQNDNHSELRKILQNAGMQEAESIIIRNLKSKDLGGSNPSTREVLLKMAEFPSAINKTEANRLISKRLVENAKRNLYQGKVINALRSYDKNMTAPEFKETVAKKVSGFHFGSVKMINPENGAEYDIPADKVEYALSKGLKTK